MLRNSWDVENSCQNQCVTPLSPVGLSLLCSSKGQISSSLHLLFESFSRLMFSEVHSKEMSWLVSVPIHVVYPAAFWHPLECLACAA